MRECDKRTRGGFPWLSQVKARVPQEVEGKEYVLVVEDHAVKEVVAGGEIGKNRSPLLQYDYICYRLDLGSILCQNTRMRIPDWANEQGCIQDRRDNNYRYMLDSYRQIRICNKRNSRND